MSDTTTPEPDEDAVRRATYAVTKGYALFRSPAAGGTELVPSEYEDFVRLSVREYLRALGNDSPKAGD